VVRRCIPLYALVLRMALGGIGAPKNSKLCPGGEQERLERLLRSWSDLLGAAVLRNDSGGLCTFSYMNFRERDTGEVRRILLLGNSVNRARSFRVTATSNECVLRERIMCQP
jgi:hypothetical protein